MYSYGLVGNCQLSALISKFGSLDWLCLPRPDSDPVFGRILDAEGGYFSIDPPDIAGSTSKQYYLENTNILVTEVTNSFGDSYRVTDFAPRFEQFGRVYRPISLFRIVEPLLGAPRVRVSCHVVQGWSKKAASAVRGNSHLRYEVQNDSLRLTTNMPLTYLCEETTFALKEKIYFALSWGAPIEDDLVDVSERFLRLTENYWRLWVKHCSVPSMFQKETIRSALALKLHCYEDTGAILAALTTSLPEEAGGTRNWDYRYCWLRDAYFVLTAFHNLGHFEEIEGFLKFFLGIMHNQEASKERLAPVYTLSQGLPLPEKEHLNWAGWRDGRPVRTFNQAAEHIQNDVYGEMLLTLSPIYRDERFLHLRNRDHDELFMRLARLCDRSISAPDAGLWEVRDGWQEHSFTNLLCWAGLDRAIQAQKQGYFTDLGFDVLGARDRAAAAVQAAVTDGALKNGPRDQTLDASLALLAILRFPDQAMALSTVRAIQSELRLGSSRPHSSFYYRYLRSDDFGRPSSAFGICSFWISQALARLGCVQEAREILDDAIEASNHLGLLAEHFDPVSRMQLGNFPQAYSHVGLINAAFAVSPPWSEVL